MTCQLIIHNIPTKSSDGDGIGLRVRLLRP